jgi:hypothetical protein
LRFQRVGRAVLMLDGAVDGEAQWVPHLVSQRRAAALRQGRPRAVALPALPRLTAYPVSYQRVRLDSVMIPEYFAPPGVFCACCREESDAVEPALE